MTSPQHQPMGPGWQKKKNAKRPNHRSWKISSAPSQQEALASKEQHPETIKKIALQGFDDESISTL